MKARFVAFLALAIPVLAGIGYMAGYEAPAAYALINAVALVLAGLWIAFGRGPTSSKARRALTVALILLVFAPLLTGPQVNDIARWIPLGPFTLHAGMLAVPAIAVLAAQDEDFAPPILLAIVLAGLIQPGAATGLAITFAAIGLHDATKDWRVGLVAIIGFFASLLMFLRGELPAAPFVERVLVDAAYVSPFLAVALLTALIAGFSLIVLAVNAEKPVRLALAGSLFGFSLAAIFSNYPNVLIGYGAAPILGYGFALGLLNARKEGKIPV